MYHYLKSKLLFLVTSILEGGNEIFSVSFSTIFHLCDQSCELKAINDMTTKTNLQTKQIQHINKLGVGNFNIHWTQQNRSTKHYFSKGKTDALFDTFLQTLFLI
jgi:hypothetical protein